MNLSNHVPVSTNGAALAGNSRATFVGTCGPASLNDYGVTLLRLGLGVMWTAHALLKLLVFTLPGTVQFFSSIGFPGLLAYPVFAAELAGGLALILGICARQVAMALVPIMAVAAWVHLPNGWAHTSAGGGWEYPVFLTVASIALWLMGDGAFAICRSKRFTPAG